MNVWKHTSHIIFYGQSNYDTYEILHRSYKSSHFKMTLNCKTQRLETTATPTQHNTLYKWLNFNVHCLPDHSVSMNSSSFHKENSDTIMKPAFLKSPLHHRHNFILYVSLYRFHLSHICIFCTSLFCNVDSSSRRKLEIKLKGTWACGPNVNVYVTTARIYPTEVFFCCCAAVQHHWRTTHWWRWWVTETATTSNLSFHYTSRGPIIYSFSPSKNTHNV